MNFKCIEPVKFSELYENVLEHWPETIVVNDNGVPSLKAEGHYFPSLSNAWKKAEEGVEAENDWLDIMVWTMFQVFHRQAMESVRRGNDVIDTRAVCRSEIERRYFENLGTPEWRSLLITYERVLT